MIMKMKKLLSKVKSRARSKARDFEYRLYIKKKRKKLKNKSPSIIASNCNGCVISHDLGLRFNTPTVNLFMMPSDFIKFVSDLDKYLSADLVEIESDERYPVGMLSDITLYFVHYNTFDEAKAKWNERRDRVDRSNLFLMFTDRDGCTDEDLKAFDALPYENKVVFTHVPRPDIKSAAYIEGYEDKGEVGVLSDFKPGFLIRRYLCKFDYA